MQHQVNSTAKSKRKQPLPILFWRSNRQETHAAAKEKYNKLIKHITQETGQQSKLLRQAHNNKVLQAVKHLLRWWDLAPRT